MLELKQDTKGLLNPTERLLWYNVRSIEHMAQIEKVVSYPWGRVMCGVDAQGNTFDLSTKYGWYPEQK